MNDLLTWLSKRIQVNKALLSTDTLLKGSVIAFIIQASGAGIKYLMQISLARWMGASEFGVFSYAYSWLLILVVFTGFGFSSSAIRFIPEYLVSNDWAKLKGYIKQSYMMVGGSSIVISILGILAIFLLPKDKNISLILIFFTLPFLAFATHQSQILRGMQNIFMAFLPTRVIQPLLVIIIAIFFFRFSGKLNSIIAISIILFSLLATITLQFYGIKNNSPKELLGTKADYNFRHWFATSTPMLITAITFSVISQVDILIVGFYLDDTTIGVYSAAVKTASLVSFLLVSVNAIVAPMIAESYSKKDIESLRQLSQKATFWMLLPTSVSVIGLLLFGKSILALFGPEFSYGYTALMILSIGQLVNALTGPVGYLTELTGHQSYHAKINTICVIISLVLNFMLIPIWGIVGAAIATALAISFGNIWLYHYVHTSIIRKPSCK